jgi:hypothetical protein
MTEAEQKWYEQYSRNFGPGEHLRLGRASRIGVAIRIVFPATFGSSTMSTLFLISLFVFPLLTGWKPAYPLQREILGNKNQPPEPMPHRHIKLLAHQLPRWAWLPGIWFPLLGFILLYMVIKFISK